MWSWCLPFFEAHCKHYYSPQLGSGHVTHEGIAISRWKWLLRALELGRYKEIPTQILSPKEDAICMWRENIFSPLLEKPKDFKIVCPCLILHPSAHLVPHTHQIQFPEAEKHLPSAPLIGKEQTQKRTRDYSAGRSLQQTQPWLDTICKRGRVWVQEVWKHQILQKEQNICGQTHMPKGKRSKDVNMPVEQAFMTNYETRHKRVAGHCAVKWKSGNLSNET